MSLTDQEIDRIVRWLGRIEPFEAIHFQFNLSEQDVIDLMRRELKEKSWKRWRKRVQGRKTKHVKLRSDGVQRHKSSRQKQITGNRISKRT